MADLNEAARRVVSHYGLSPATAHPLGNHGGFSGARLWRVEAGGAAFCLRAWPAAEPTPERLRWVHGLMAAARGAGLVFVPHVVPVSGTTVTGHAGRLWDLSTWLPGRADFRQLPTASRLWAACVALGRLHRAWADLAPARGPCPALERRLQRTTEWLSLVSTGWRPRCDEDDPVRPWAERAWRLLGVWAERTPAVLAPWASRLFLLHPCLCDVWHDHVLFEGEDVTGIVDYGSTRVDHAAADLARLLGSLVGDDAAAWDDGLNAYAAVRPLSPQERELARALDRGGVILGAANWLKWLYWEGRVYEDRHAVADRLAVLVRRMEGWSFFSEPVA